MTVKCPVNPKGRLEETAAMMERYDDKHNR